MWKKEVLQYVLELAPVKERSEEGEGEEFRALKVSRSIGKEPNSRDLQIF